MRLKIQDIINKHKGKPCVVTTHGPSLDDHLDQVLQLQKDNKVIRISVNEWYDFIERDPDYWVVSSGEFNIGDSITKSGLWNMRRDLPPSAYTSNTLVIGNNTEKTKTLTRSDYPEDVFNKYKHIPLFYNRTADLTDPKFVEENLKNDYIPYDNKHFKGDNCREMLTNFKMHYEENKNLNFTDYGNNSQMWQKPDINDPILKEIIPNTKELEYSIFVHKNIAGHWSPKNKCCRNLDGSLTLQEELQVLSGHEQHMTPGHTVGMFALTFAVIMGCDPIYVSGFDLNYNLGYASSIEPGINVDSPGPGCSAHINTEDAQLIAARACFISTHDRPAWVVYYKQFLLDDMRILKESAENLGINIINLNKDSWHEVFEKGELPS
tara:strand:- start:12836 stop:13972 length:1137 start_codon:yes stop_codon:yes gene_type:complete